MASSAPTPAPEAVAAGVVRAVAAAAGWKLPPDIRAARHRPARAVEAAVGAHLGPAALGKRYEACLVPEARRRRTTPRASWPPAWSPW
ncbi:MAG: hypothetical protein R2746_11965 [Acidimicrobiales bacterium]